MDSISVVLPAYNEEKNIGPMVSEVVEVMSGVTEDYEVLVVNDGSRDGTARAVGELAQRYPQVQLINHEVNKGYGAALYTGLTSARKQWIFFTDSDKQFNVAEISRLLPFMEQADLIAGLSGAAT